VNGHHPSASWSPPSVSHEVVTGHHHNQGFSSSHLSHGRSWPPLVSGQVVNGHHPSASRPPPSVSHQVVAGHHQGQGFSSSHPHIILLISVTALVLSATTYSQRRTLTCRHHQSAAYVRDWPAPISAELRYASFDVAPSFWPLLRQLSLLERAIAMAITSLSFDVRNWILWLLVIW